MHFRCPHCDAALQGRREQDGKRVRCSRCGKAFEAHGPIVAAKGSRPEQDAGAAPEHSAPKAPRKGAGTPGERFLHRWCWVVVVAPLVLLVGLIFWSKLARLGIPEPANVTQTPAVQIREAVGDFMGAVKAAVGDQALAVAYKALVPSEAQALKKIESLDPALARQAWGLIREGFYEDFWEFRDIEINREAGTATARVKFKEMVRIHSFVKTDDGWVRVPDECLVMRGPPSSSMFSREMVALPLDEIQNLSEKDKSTAPKIAVLKYEVARMSCDYKTMVALLPAEDRRRVEARVAAGEHLRVAVEQQAPKLPSPGVPPPIILRLPNAQVEGDKATVTFSKGRGLILTSTIDLVREKDGWKLQKSEVRPSQPGKPVGVKAEEKAKGAEVMPPQ